MIVNYFLREFTPHPQPPPQRREGALLFETRYRQSGRNYTITLLEHHSPPFLGRGRGWGENGLEKDITLKT
jgi:hypothetical protein